MRQGDLPHPGADGGYSLVELVVIVVIIGILAAIAIPTFLTQRDSGFRAAVSSDVRNAGMAVSSAMTGGATAPDGLQLPPDVVTPSEAAHPVLVTAVTDGVLLAFARDDDGTAFCVAGAHEHLPEVPVAVYDSTRGGLADGCSFDADFELAAALPGPVTFAGRFRDDGGYISGQTEAGGFSTGAWGRELLADGQDISRGSFELLGATASFGSSTGGGWAAVVHGGHDDDGDFAGYTVQIDRGFEQIVLREWVDGRELSPVVRVDPPDGFKWDAPRDVRVEVDGSSVRLFLDGEEALHYDDMEREQGAFGVRTWGSTNLDVTSSEVSVERD